MFDKRKWLAAIISITLIVGILQPCLAESAQNYDNETAAAENDTEPSVPDTAEEEPEQEPEETVSPSEEPSSDEGENTPEEITQEGTGTDSDASGTVSDTQQEEKQKAEATADTVEFSDGGDEGTDTVPSGENVVNIDKYIRKASVFYQQGENWIPVGDNTADIPADARFKITLNYSGVNTADVVAHGKTIWYDIPDLFLDPSVASNVIQDSNGNEIGTIQADKQTRSIRLTFTDEFLEQEEAEGASQITGSFSFYGSADQEQVKNNPDQILVIGDQQIHLKFEKDSDARLGTLNLQKSAAVFSQDENGSYLQYTLTVTSGETPMPDVKVTDMFTANVSYVDCYLGVTGQEESAASENKNADIPYESGKGAGQGSIYLGNSTSDTKTIPEPAGDSLKTPGTLVWKVGDMGANETRSLTYKVRLKTGYTGAQSRGTITNHGASFSKGYPHQETSVNFTPSINASITKKAVAYEKDSSGNGGSITYQITVSASANNTYPLNNVKIYDSLPGGGTAQKYFNSLEYVRESFKLYDGNKVDENARLDIPENPHKGKSNPDITETAQNHQFDIYVGTLKPGEQRTLTYQLRVKENIFTLGNETVNIGNTAGVYSDDTVSGGNHRFASSKVTKSLGKKVWDRKLQSQKTDQTAEISIPSGESVYVADKDSWKEEKNSGGTFTVPAGSYRYQVVVNEDGNWDVSSSVFGDALKNDYLAYKGYMKLDYYAKGLSEQPASDAEAVKLLEKEPSDQTVWVKIDEQKNFSFSPSALGLAGKKGAFVLTYYAVPRNTEDVSEVSSGNSFGVSGTVTGPGGTTTEISGSGVRVSTSVVIEGGNKFEASKTGWYFDHNKASSGDWMNGRLYWVIDVSGSELQAGTEFQDVPSGSGYTVHQMKRTSMTGLYVGKVPEGKSFTDYYGSIKDLEADPSMKKLTGNELNGGSVPADADYSWTATSAQATISIKKNIKLSDGEHLYIVISTAPYYTMNNRDCRTFKNSLLVKDSKATDFINQNDAEIRAVGAGNNFKEMAGIYDYDGKTWKKITGTSSSGKLLTDRLTKPGTYVEWRIKLNYGGDLEGKVSVEDLIPEGMEPVYARYFWINPGLFDNPPEVPEIPELEGNDQWQKMVTTGKIDGSNPGNNTYTCNAYYNKQTRQLRFDASNLFKGGTDRDQKSLEIQVVTRLTDTDMMLNGTTKNYTNGITVKNDSGKVISTSAATASITKKTIAKTKGAVTSSKLPFTITVNSLGEDLLKDSDTITLVDELSAPLQFDPDSLEIKDKSGTKLTGITPSIEETATGEKMTLTIPDDRMLTITYNASLNSAPDTDIPVKNAAYWFGYSKTVAEIKDVKVSYHVEATAGTSSNPVISVKKADKDAVGKGLAGAEFTLQPVVWNDAEACWKPAENGQVLQGTTGDDGTVSFGKQTNKLEYNTAYCLKEIKAPEGYILDNTPRYYVVAKKIEGDDGEEKYPPQLSLWAQHGAEIYYSGATFKTTVYNRRGTLEVEKRFQDVNGDSITETDTPDGTYSFGVYSYEENGNYQNKKPLQILTITARKGKLSFKRDGTDVERPEFTQLPAGGKYCVFELDSSQNPVTENNAVYTGKTGLSFKVIYPDGIKGVTISSDGKAEAVSIINRQYVDMEPGTGIFTGPVKPYEMTLLFLAAVAAVGIFRYRRKKMKHGRR